MKYLYLGLAIVLEVLGSSFLTASNQFTKIIPTGLMVVGYLGSFYFLSLSLRELPLGTAYAIWAGLGIVLTTLVSVFIFKNKIDIPAIIGILLIISGVVVLNLFSKTSGH